MAAENGAHSWPSWGFYQIWMMIFFTPIANLTFDKDSKIEGCFCAF